MENLVPGEGKLQGRGMCQLMGAVFAITVCTLTGLWTALTSHPTPQPPLLIYALPATCWVFQHITLHFSLHCFTPIRKTTVVVYNQAQLGKHDVQLPRENCLLELQSREMTLTLVCVPLKMWSHQIYMFASDTSSKKKRRSSRGMKHIY